MQQFPSSRLFSPDFAYVGRSFRRLQSSRTEPSRPTTARLCCSAKWSATSDAFNLSVTLVFSDCVGRTIGPPVLNHSFSPPRSFFQVC